MRKSILRAGGSVTALAMATLCGLSVPALAQDNAAADTGAIETVVVTSQRVKEDLQKVPLSVSAFSAQALADSHIETVADIALRTPGFTAVQINSASPNYTIRGIGSSEGVSQNAGGDPSVVTFFDGVYVGRGGTADIDAYDLERVEVLRGPQGTLFGKNAIGGLIQLISKKPDDQRSMKLSGTIGNYDLIGVNGQVNVPLTDNLFFSGGVSHKGRSGYTYNETTGNHVDDLNISTVQGQLRYVANNDLEFLLAADYTDQDQRGQPRHNICDATFAGGIHCVGINPDPRTVNAYTDGYIKRKLATVRGEINWHTALGDVTSITAFRKVRLGYLTPFFSNPVNPPAQIESTETDHEDNKQFSQEVRLAFNTWNDRLDGVVGAYYLHESNNRTEDLLQQFPAPSISGFARYPQSVRARSTAVFGQVNLHIFDGLTATAGARMTWEKKSGDFAGFVVSAPTPTSLPPPLSGNYAVTGSKKWHAFTPRFGLNWQVNDGIMLYASASRGYKSGGFQGIAGSAAGASTAYDPEFAWSYEAGVKSQWFRDRLHLNASIYQTDYNDLQVSQLIPLCCVVVGNAAKARIKGFELEFIARPAPGLQVDGSYSYLHAKYISFLPTATANYSGNYLTRSPKNKFNLGVQYSHSFNDWLATARVDYLYTGSYFFDPNNIPTQTQPAYSMVDARLSISPPDSRWEVSLWGKNLGDKLVATYVTAFAPYKQVLVPYAPPRTFGVTLTFKD
ncbi:MAG TPA: TonB-dependent receptor [Rhizomicrobium sp.]|nr:TonB-dependent receptor [Rhizomicrobium sp.]